MKRVAGLRFAICHLAALAALGWCGVATAAPTQEEVFRSISSNVGESAEVGKVLAVLLGTSAVTVGAIALTQRNREKKKRALNNPKKLVKEVVRQMDLPGKQMRKYKAVAEEKGLSSPLVAMLCPSLMTADETREK